MIGGFYSNIDRDYAQDLTVAGFSAASGIPSKGVVAPTDHLYFSTVPYKQIGRAAGDGAKGEFIGNARGVGYYVPKSLP